MKQDKEAQIGAIGDIIYKALKEDNVTAGIRDRAYIADILSQALYDAGYRKPSGQPKLVRNNPYENIPFREGQPVWVVGVLELHKAYEDGKKIQLESDIKYYEAGEPC